MSLMSSAAVHRSPFVIDHLLRALSGNRAAAKKLVRIFLDMYPNKVAQFDAAVETSDWTAMRRVVHDLRGNCAIVSASSCLVSAAALEDALPEHVSPGFLLECARFKAALEEVVSALNEFMADPTESVPSSMSETDK